MLLPVYGVNFNQQKACHFMSVEWVGQSAGFLVICIRKREFSGVVLLKLREARHLVAGTQIVLRRRKAPKRDQGAAGNVQAALAPRVQNVDYGCLCGQRNPAPQV
jgi:hypothetical protein